MGKHIRPVNFLFCLTFLAVTNMGYAFTSVKIATLTAGTTVGGTPIADFSFVLRNISDPFGVNQASLTWSNVTAGSTQWKLSDQLIIINSTVTAASGGIKIYTDNTQASAVPRFIDPTPTNAFNIDSWASGLLDTTVPTTNAPGLPLAWSIKSSTRIVEGGTEFTGIGASDPNTGPSGPTFNNRFQWLFFTDTYNWTLGVDRNANGILDPTDDQPQALDSPFVTMINRVGIHFGQDSVDFGPHPDGANAYIYLEADFTNAQSQTPYGTSAIRIEAYIQ